MKKTYMLFSGFAIFIAALVSPVTFLQAQTVIIDASSTWKYLDDGSNQGTNWRLSGFNDATWRSGAAELGYGDSPITGLAASKIGYYFRKNFSIVNPSQYSSFTMRIRRDDGIVVYVNNVELYRNNMPAGLINYNTVASSTCTDDGNAILTLTLPNSVFANGNNLIAAEVHNRKTSSSDITFELSIIANSTTSCGVPNVNLFGNRNKTSSSAEVFWTAVSGAVSYNVAYRIRNSGAAYSATIRTNSTFVVLTNLQQATNYEFIVQSVCAGNATSAYSASGWFTTLQGQLANCVVPNYLLFGNRNKTSTSAEVFWVSVPGAVSYNVAYRIRNSGAAYSAAVNSTTTAVVISNLQPSTNYEFIVQAVCTGGQSAFSQSGWFTTLGSTPLAILTRGPYMPIATSNSITIQWRTSVATGSEVKYGTSLTQLNFTASDLNATTDHAVTLTGLSPNTKYFYSIGTSGITLQGDVNNYFHTAPVNNSTQPVRFWVASDFGSVGSRQTAVRNSFTNYTSGQVVNGWIWCGDNSQTNGTDQEYQTEVFNVYNSILKNTPIFPTLGNHDYGQTGYQSSSALGVNFPYFNIFKLPTASGTEKYYSVDYGSIHFISLDSYGSYNDPSSAMYNWLNNDLSNNAQQWTIVYFHTPPYTKGSHDSDNEIALMNMRTNILPLLESYGVDLVMSGHSHIYERSNFIKNHTGLENTFNSALYPSGNIVQSGGGPYSKLTRTGNGTVYVVCGLGSMSPGTTQPGFPHNAMYKSNTTNNGSLILDIDGGSLTCKFLTSTGVIDDEFTIQKPLLSPGPHPRASRNIEKNENSVSIYPNPSSGDVNIRLSNPDMGRITVSIYNITGKLQFQQSFPNTTDESILIERSESNLSPGVYILNVSGENLHTSEKLVVY